MNMQTEREPDVLQPFATHGVGTTNPTSPRDIG